MTVVPAQARAPLLVQAVAQQSVRLLAADAALSSAPLPEAVRGLQ